MQLLLSTMVQEFRRKGISGRLFPDLLTDIQALLKNKRHPSIQHLNAELEDLGWGIRIIDPPIYEHILQIHHKHSPRETTAK